jgi:hypothetical protein
MFRKKLTDRQYSDRATRYQCYVRCFAHTVYDTLHICMPVSPWPLGIVFDRGSVRKFSFPPIVRSPVAAFWKWSSNTVITSPHRGSFQLQGSVFTRSTHYHSVLCVLNRARNGNFWCLNCKVVKWAAGREVADCPYGLYVGYVHLSKYSVPRNYVKIFRVVRELHGLTNECFRKDWHGHYCLKWTVCALCQQLKLSIGWFQSMEFI